MFYFNKITKNKLLSVLVFFMAVTVTLNSQGVEQQWVKTYSFMSNSENIMSDMVIDGSSNIYITGGSEGNGTGFDFCTVKYNVNGNQQWVVRYSGVQQDEGDLSNAITADYEGNIYATGYHYTDTGTNINIYTVKYNPAGTKIWSSSYAGPGILYDFGHDIHVDNLHNVYVTGRTEYNSGAQSKFITIKYNSLGVQQWKAIRNSSFPDLGIGTSVTSDGIGNVYVAGTADGNAVVIKYSSSGSQIWERSYSGGAPSMFNHLERDYSGNIIAAGYTGTNNMRNFLIVKYNADGEVQWTKVYNGTGNGQDEINGLAVDYTNNVYVTGMAQGNSNLDYATIKFSPSGEQKWITYYNDVNNNNDWSNDITFDGQGNIYVTGKTDKVINGHSSDIATIKYNSDGIQQWVVKYDAPGNKYDVGHCIIRDNLGNLVISGTSYVNGHPYYCTIKYTPLNGIQILGGEIPASYSLSQNYPNPFNPVTNINFSVPKSGNVRLAVYDIMGREVASPVNEYLQAGSYKYDFDASGLSSGTYFYRMTTNDFSEVKKMILVK
jgi:uncharacterized delta-60 repeat protein